jgi:hypothetical protein
LVCSIFFQDQAFAKAVFDRFNFALMQNLSDLKKSLPTDDELFEQELK